ncbi:MAG: Fur family transcriptional regulator [Bacillota bacterium]
MNNEELKKILKDNEIQVTKTRLQILNIIVEKKKPLTATEIDEIAKDKKLNIRLSTIYRNLKFFTKNEILRQLNFFSDEKRYEMLVDNHHQHLICLKCGEILPIKCPLAKFEKEIEKETNYEIKKHDMEMYGICPKCQKKINKSK